MYSYSNLIEATTKQQSVTWHMGSRSFTCHLTQVNVPHLNPSQTVRQLICLLWRARGLSWDWRLVTYQDSLPVRRQSPILVVSRWQWLDRESNPRAVDHKFDALLLRTVRVAVTSESCIVDGNTFADIIECFQTDDVLRRRTYIITMRRIIWEWCRRTWNIHAYHKSSNVWFSFDLAVK